MSSTMLDTLLDHDRWATSQMIDACDRLSDEQLDRMFEIGPGCLRATLIHCLAATHRWIASIEGFEPLTFDPRASVPTIRGWHERIAGELERFASAQPIGEPVTAQRPPRTLVAPRAAIVSHLLTHAMHHRAQMLNMLRHLGIKPLPASSVLEWMLATGVAQMSVSSS